MTFPVMAEDPTREPQVHPLFARIIAQHFPHLRHVAAATCAVCGGTERVADHPCPKCHKEDSP